MARYKLRRKRNGISREKSDLWYAEPSPAQRMKARQLCRFATQHTTMGNMELMMALEILAQYLPAVLAQGTIVEVGRLGTLQLAYGSEGVEEPEDFNYHLIRRRWNGSSRSSWTGLCRGRIHSPRWRPIASG